MSTYFQDVGDFHRKFEIPAFDPRNAVAFPSVETFMYRKKFLEEELREFIDAFAEGDLEKALDALVDLTYVTLGTAQYFNAPFHQLWMEVQRANMDKVRVTRENCPPEKQYRADEGLVMKPPGWRPPELAKIIEQHNNFARRMIRRKL